MRLMRSILLCLNVLFLLVCIVACGPERPKEILSDAQMEEVLYDYHAAKTLGEAVSPSAKYKATRYYLDVFDKHHTTEADFASNFL